MRLEQAAQERMGIHDYYLYQSQEAERISHKNKRRIFQAIRSSAPTAGFVVLGSNVTIGNLCCFHLLQKGRAAQDPSRDETSNQGT